MPADFSPATATPPPSESLQEESAWIGVGVLVALTAAMTGYVLWVLRAL